MPNFWHNCLEAAEESRYFILHYSELGYGTEEILLEYEDAFRNEEIQSEQPLNAFRINTRNMIETILRER